MWMAFSELISRWAKFIPEWNFPCGEGADTTVYVALGLLVLLVVIWVVARVLRLLVGVLLLLCVLCLVLKIGFGVDLWDCASAWLN